MPNPDSAVKQIESLLDEIGQADPQLQKQAEEIIRLLMELYGSALARALEILGPEASASLAEDKVVASILLLHGLHPVDAATRITQALSRVERRLDGHRVHFAGIADDVARVRVELNGGPPPHALAEAIERAITDCAPDIAGVSIEGLPQTLVQISSL